MHVMYSKSAVNHTGTGRYPKTITNEIFIQKLDLIIIIITVLYTCQMKSVCR